MAYYTPEELETMRNSLKEAKNNPDNPRSQEIFKRIQDGKMNFELKALGLPTVDVPKPKVNLQQVMADAQQVEGQQSVVEEPDVNLASVTKDQVKGAASDVGQDFMQMGRNIKEGFERRVDTLGSDIARRKEDGKLTLREQAGTGLGMASAALRTGFDALGEAGMFAIKSVMTPEQEATIAEKFQQGLASGLEATEGTRGRQMVEQMVAGYNVWAEENPEAAANTRDVSGIMLSLAEAAGFKGGSIVAREAADIAADAVTTAARQADDIARTVGPKIDEGLQTAARAAGETMDARMTAARAARVESQNTKVDEAVGRITQAGADERAKEQARRALLELDTSDVRTYEDLNETITDQISTLSRKVDTELDAYPDKKSLDELAKVTQVGGEVVTENPVQAALDGLEEAYSKTGEAANAARIRQLRQQAESEGLTLRQVNELAREYGIEFRSRAFTKTGDIKTGFSAENYENTRKSLKEVLRGQMPDDITRELDMKISDLYSTRDLTSKIEDRVAKLQQRIKNRTLAQKVGAGAASVADMLTFGSLRGFVARLLPSNVGNKAMNALEIQDELNKNLKELNKLLKLKDNDKFADAFEEWAKTIQPGMSIRSTVRRPDQIAQDLDIQDYRTIKEYLLNPADKRAFPKAQQLMERLGIENATDAEQMRFLEDIVNEFDRTENAGGVTVGKPDESFNQPATAQTTNLVEEAKKYKTADEFVNSFIFHGTKQNFDTVDFNKVGSGSTGNVAGTGFYATDSYDLAKMYADVANENIPIPGLEVVQNNPGVVLMTKKPSGNFVNFGDLLNEKHDRRFYLEGLKRMEEAGFTGVSKDPNVLVKLEKSRLSDDPRLGRVTDNLDIEIKNNSRYANLLKGNYSILDYFIDKEKYDGIIMESAGFPGFKGESKDIILFNKGNEIKMYPGRTRTQLEDIWKQANR